MFFNVRKDEKLEARPVFEKNGSNNLMWVRFNHIINIAKNRKVSEFRRKWTAYFYSDRRPQRRKTSSISSFEKMDLI